VKRRLPAWLTGYRRALLPGDLTSGPIVTVVPAVALNAPANEPVVCPRFS